MKKATRYEIEKMGSMGSRIILILLVLFVLFVLFVTVRLAFAAQVTLQWDANDPAPDGYRVYQRVVGTDYNYERAVCDTKDTTCTVEDLQPGVQYFFVARAYVAQNSSGDSNEVDFIPDISAPQNLKIVVEISVLIDNQGVAHVTQLTANEGGGGAYGR